MSSQPPANCPDHRALKSLYDAHFDFVWRALRRLGVPENDVLDAIQEVFLTVLRKLPEFEGRSKITTWLFQIAIGVASTRRRKAYLRREVLNEHSFEEFTTEQSSPEEALAFREDIKRLDAVLSALNLEQRAVFVMFELEQMNCEEIALTLNIPIGTVYSRLRLGRAAFQRALHQLSSHKLRAIPRIAMGTTS
jgi:RNA polymerase sigma-70 factor (ECF subfamily)